MAAKIKKSSSGGENQRRKISKRKAYQHGSEKHQRGSVKSGEQRSGAIEKAWQQRRHRGAGGNNQHGIKAGGIKRNSNSKQWRKINDVSVAIAKACSESGVCMVAA